MKFKLHTKESAPKESQSLLDNSEKSFGMIPNLHAVMAESPPLLEAYQTLHSLFQQTKFDADELTVIWQTINIEHDCHYCVPAHEAIAVMMKIDRDILDALRNRKPMPNEKLQALHITTLALIQNRGRLDESDIDVFFSAGYEQVHLLEIILGISQKVMSNYVNHITQTPVDSAFSAFI